MHHTNNAYNVDMDRISINASPTARSTPGRQIHRRNSNHLTLEQHVPNVEIKTSSTSSSDDDSYYSLKRFRERRRGERDEDEGLSRRVKRFYKSQDELIDVYERVHNQHSEHGEALLQAEEEQLKQIQRMSNIMTKVSLAVNIVSHSR